jgi:hypothetical protein
MSRLHCQVCRCKADLTPKPGGFEEISCPRCGAYSISGSLIASLTSDPEKIAKLSGWIREQNDYGNNPELTSYNIDKILANPNPLYSERVDRFLLKCAKTTDFRPGHVSLSEPEFIATIYGKNSSDLFDVLTYLEKKSYITNITTGDFRLSIEGMMRVDELMAKNPMSRQAFVAMWFSEDMNSAFSDGFDPAIRAAGYIPVRVDKVEHANDINDEIIVQIKRSRFVVSDMTGHRNGCYFEAGYAMGLGLPVILTCRHDHKDELHFDLRQFNCLEWSDFDMLKQALTRRILHVIGEGPVQQ